MPSKMKRSKSYIGYEQVDGDSGDEEERQYQQRTTRNRLSSVSCTASTSISNAVDDCTIESLNARKRDGDKHRSINMKENGTTGSGHGKMASNFDKFRLLMWKNGLLQWRHPTQTIIEIIVPVLFSVILVMIRSIVSPDVFRSPTIYKPFEINTLDPLSNTAKNKSNLVNDWRLVYAPKNEILHNLTLDAARALGLKGVIGVHDSSQIEAYMSNQRLVAGVLYKHPKNITEIPTNLAYALRFPAESRSPPPGIDQPLIFNWRTNFLFPLFSAGGPRNGASNDGGYVWYFFEGFLPIQDSIARAYTKMKCKHLTCKDDPLPNIMMQRYPYPPYTFDLLLQGLETIVSFFILLSFIYPSINLVRFIAIEKERQLKEAMKIMGLSNWLHWISWFLRTMIFMVISISCIVALLKTTMFEESVSVFTHSDWTAIWVFMFVYSISMTTFCFMLSVFFSKANTAAAVAGLMWFVLYVPFTFTQQNYAQMSLSSKLTVCLSSNTAMAYGFQLILRFEGIGEGLQWSNFWRPVNVDDNLTVGLTMCLMLVTSCIYMLITLYVEKVMPGSYGVPEKWYFPLSKEFWFGTPEYIGVEDSSDPATDQKGDKHNLNFEPDPQHRNAGVRVKNLRKVYANKKVACQGLTLNMFDDQITVLLGHNGAGKTTTMSMLTGMFPPTSGTALINGHDIRTNLYKARSSIGLCPQHNILFDELTVREHIIFYSRLKGLSSEEIVKEVDRYVQLLELEPKINAMSASLSGGMKRKLSVGVALCGRSKVVFCDEPSSGMDPAARRALWDLLQTEKQGRTILLTTHFMDEADVLGDRIAIMSEGELKCCGSSFFLKKRFGTGYHLICVKNENCDSSAVTNILRQYIPNIEIDSEIGSELSYDLPAEFVDRFEKMFQVLEEEQSALKLGSFGVSLTSLEEVFMKVGADSTQSDEVSNGHSSVVQHGTSNGNTSNGNNTRIVGTEMPLLHGFRLRANQWYAMLKKKYIYWKRSWIMFVLQILIPILFVVISVMIVRMFESSTILPALEMSLSTYGQSVTMLQTPSNNSGDDILRITEQYRNVFKTLPSESALYEFSEGIGSRFLELAKTILIRLNSRYLVGYSYDSVNKSIIAWFNNQPFHTAALSMNMVHNAMVKARFGSNHSISVTNWPLPFRVESRLSFLLGAGNNMGFQLATNISFAMAFVSGFYVMFYIKERVSKAKLLQFVSGINVSTFWSTSFLFDFCTYIFTVILIMITIICFREEGYTKVSELSPVFAVLILFGFAMLPITFVCSNFFSIPSTGFVRMTIIYIFTGITVFFVIMAMSFPGFKLEDKANALKWFFLIFPHYSLSSSLNNLNTINTMDRVCQQKCEQLIHCDRDLLCQMVKQCCVAKYFDWEEPGIGRNTVYMIATGIFFFALLLIIEYRFFAGLIYFVRSFFARKLPLPSVDNAPDNDVIAEKQKVNAMTDLDLCTNNLVLQNLSKFYGKFLAVNQISIGIKQSECFGLLGINGAGKTSTFKMLTGDVQISSGEAYVRGISLKKDMPQVHKTIGYCPQFDALIEDLTGRETLEMFALLRGVRSEEIESLTIRLAVELNFMKHIDKRILEYSGGNKRKLSTAIALIGNPVVIYLDEPTTGMDPGAKRHLWNMVSKVRSSGKSIVLTSHSMEECEALCTRLAIMVNGEFQCLGSTQHLKSKFSKGFLLSVKVRKGDIEKSFEDVLGELIKNRSLAGSFDSRAESLQIPNDIHIKIQRIKNYVSANFPGANLREEFQGLLTYYVPPTEIMKWSRMFSLMEEGKQTLDIEDYSISQTSLEQVFLSFTKYQRDEINGNGRPNE